MEGIDKANRLKVWQERYDTSKSSYNSVTDLMQEREELYRGTRKIDAKSTATSTATKSAEHTRNIIFELVEAQVDSNIPWPKVEPRYEISKERSRKIECSLRADKKRIPFEKMNDQDERTTLVQGGDFLLVEWDNTIKTHHTVGDLSVSIVHPKNVIPQAGMYDLDSSDYIFIRIERTKAYMKRRYGIDVVNETNTEPGTSTVSEDNLMTKNTSDDLSDDKILHVICYYKNDDGGIGLFSWVGDTIIEDYDDYQARQMDVCAKCGKEQDGDKCECGGKVFKQKSQNTEVLQYAVAAMGSDGKPVFLPVGAEVPYYKPNRFPLVLRKNVSMFGSFMGSADPDIIRDQQMTINKFGSKILEKLLSGGSILTLPIDMKIETTNDEMKIVRIQSPDDINSIQVRNLQPDIQYDSIEREKSHEDAKSLLGITDSFLGRPDPTADSGVAKQVQVAQSTGRLESKRIMKNAAYTDLYELMFLFKLAYTDEPRPFQTINENGEKAYGTFSRYDFLCIDDAGELYYDDQFLFSIDPSGALGANRQQMWEEVRKNFHEGVYGTIQDPRSLLYFWKQMENLGYPNASENVSYAQKLVEEYQQMQAQQAQMQQQAMQQQMAQEQMKQQSSGNVDARLKGMAGR